MELKEIRQLIDLMKKNGLSVFKMEKEGFKITLKTEADTITPVMQAVSPSFVQAAAPAPAVAPAAAPAVAEIPDNVKEVTSPMVGTFYSSPSPDSPSYVEIGQDVTSDTVVCIVEAMKVMNEIKAEIAGKVVEVLVENGKPVQFGQALFRVKV